MSWQQQLLLIAAPATPLMLCLLMLVRRLRPTLFSLMPAASLPALAAACLLPAGISQPLPLALLGGGLTMSATAQPFLGVSALLWLLAAIHARSSISDGRGRFAGWWLTTLSGNMLLFVATDVIIFYLAFALLSLAAFGLVIHRGTAEALRAGQTYLVLAILGETCLLLGLMLAFDAAGTILIAEMPQAIAASPHRDLTLAMLVAGFGIKAGLMPLHVWLPLAHPAAPVPASAVLSGAIVKAGIFGMLVFLPLGAGLPEWSSLLMMLGIATALLAALIGIAQQRAKTVLAYSTVSQMGLIIAVLGAGLSNMRDVTAAVSFYAAHHSLAKGALFLSVGLLPQTSGRMRTLLLAATALLALAVAGLPLTGGALAKLALKSPLDDGPLVLLLSVSAAGTTMLMLRVLQLARAMKPEATRAPAARLMPLFALTLAASMLPWLLFADAAGNPPGYALLPANLWAAIWPIALGSIVVLAGMMLPTTWRFSIPEGDIVVPARALVRRILAWPAWQRPWLVAVKPCNQDLLLRAARAEQWLARWRVAGMLLLGLSGILLVALSA